MRWSPANAAVESNETDRTEIHVEGRIVDRSSKRLADLAGHGFAHFARAPPWLDRNTLYRGDTHAMKVATWNVNGVRAREAQLLAWLADERPDVVCLQETKASLHQVPASLREHPDYHARWHGNGGYSGVALLLATATYPAPPVFASPPFDFETRLVTAEVPGDLVFASMYGPNGGKDFDAKMTFLRALAAWTGELEAAGKHLVLCGDFNVARTDRDVHPSLRADMIGQTPAERALIEEVFAHGLVDVHRFVDPDNDRLFSWWAPWRNMRPRNIGWRLDYIAASHALVDHGVTCRVARTTGTSDHGPVVATLRDTPLVPRAG